MLNLNFAGTRAVATRKRVECDCDILMTSGVHSYWVLAAPGTVIGAASINKTGFALGQRIPNSMLPCPGGILKIEVNVDTREITFTTPDLRTSQALALRGNGPLRLGVKIDHIGGFVQALAYSVKQLDQ